MAEVVEGYDYVVGVGLRWVDAVVGPTVSLASAPVSGGGQQCTITLRALPALC
jgi:hypothetical protein